MAKVNKCVVCDLSEEVTPLITLHYKKKQLHLCTSHLPLVIHELEKISEDLDKAVEVKHEKKQEKKEEKKQNKKQDKG